MKYVQTASERVVTLVRKRSQSAKKNDVRLCVREKKTPNNAHALFSGQPGLNYRESHEGLFFFA